MFPSPQPSASAWSAASRCKRASPLRECLVALLVIGLTVGSAVAGPFSQLFVFGDSLSDVGNISQATFGSNPGEYYYNGRFSNGPVYAELLASGLGLPPLTHSKSGGNNFAHGGAKTSGTPFPYSIFIRDVDDQVGDLPSSPMVDENALFVVFAGANDLLDGQTNMSIPVNRLATDIGRLIARGARQFLVANLPLLGYTPRFNGNPTNLSTYNARSEQFNATLDAKLDELEEDNSAITLFRFDVAGLFNQALSDPAAFGLTNVMDPAAPGLQPGDSSYSTSQIAANPNEYMFWDDLHPTTAVHAILANYALELLLARPGDFNEDGSVNAADYVVWRSEIGTAAEYDAWRAHFGQSASGGAPAGAASQNAAVPEPAGLILWAFAGIPCLGAARRRGAIAHAGSSPRPQQVVVRHRALV